MKMRSIAVYSLKGGVGKTTISVNLAWSAAARSNRKSLLWDLDGQAASSFLLGGGTKGSGEEAQAVFARDVAPSKLIQPTATPGLDLLPADASLRQLDRFFFTLGKKKRLEKLLERLGRDYERIVLDCPPGLAETSEQVLRAADLIIVPVIPSPLSRRAFDEVVEFLDRHEIRRGAVLPVYNMVDRRRSMHLEALEANPKWPTIPMASSIEAMSARHEAVGSFAPRSPAAVALSELWAAIERRLGRTPKDG
ncbi:MAG TPA: ParA family protein [Allosphingosinicella sp.]|jgi:cellulose biosynthesis protein BcsQ